MQRKTRQYTAIRRAFERAGRPLRPQECLDIAACPGGFAGLAPSGYRVNDHELILYGVCRSYGR